MAIWSRAGVDEHKLPLKDVTCAAWDPALPVLVMGTAKGNVVMYDDRTQEVMSQGGAHSKRVTHVLGVGASKFVMISEDKTLSALNVETAAIFKTLTFRSPPTGMIWNPTGSGDGVPGDQLPPGWLSVTLEKKRLFVVRVAANGVEETPLELQYLATYGDILSQHWFGKGYILVAFTGGQVVVQSVYGREVVQEVCSTKVTQGQMKSCAFCPQLSRAACLSGGDVKVVDVGAEIKEIAGEQLALPVPQAAMAAEWAQDGSVLTVANDRGSLTSYVGALPPLCSSFGPSLCWLSSLNEVSVMDARGAGGEITTVGLTMEPAVLVCGPSHFACSLNNVVWYYPHDAVDGGFVLTKDFVGSVDDVAVTEGHGVVLSDGRVYLHELPGGRGGAAGAGDDVVLPGKGQPGTIQALASCEQLVVYSTEDGKLVTYCPATAVVVDEYVHRCAVSRMWPNRAGTKVVFVDAASDMFLYTPVNGLAIPVFDGAEGSVRVAERVVWDSLDDDFFLVCGKKAVQGYLHSHTSVHGPKATAFQGQRIGDVVPMALLDGLLMCQVGGGGLTKDVLPTHLAARHSSGSRERFHALVRLGRLEEAWEVGLGLESTDEWTALAFAALDALDVELASRCFRATGDAGMVMTLAGLLDCEDKNLLAGHVMALVHQNYDQAQRLLLASSQKAAALDLRRDLRHWDKALDLAREFEPGSVGEVSAEYARMLETRCDWESALGYYEEALGVEGARDADERDERQVGACQAGKARCLVHLGRAQEGKALCLALKDRALCRELGHILENTSQVSDAAEMFLAAGLLEKAAAIYIRAKNWSALRPLMPKVKSVQVHADYAAMQEREGRFPEAASSYEACGDYASAVRLLLDKLNNPSKAFQLARKTRSADAALIVATYCVNVGEMKQAVDFLVIAGRRGEAFDKVAVNHDLVDHLVGLLEDQDEPDTPVLAKAAQWYQARGQWRAAAKCVLRCREWESGVDLLLKDGSEAALEEAIQAVAEHPPVAGQILSWIENRAGAGAERNVLSNKYMFRLQMALGKPEEAAHHAVRHAQLEREEAGNYRGAHRTLSEMYRELLSAGRRVPAELAAELLLVHSYILVRALVRAEDHLGAARMLARVAASISRFPLHVVPILTSAVIECQRAGLKATAFQHAATLMRPEYKSQVGPQHRRKIEGVVRKRALSEELPEESTPCVRCGVPGPETSLDCQDCKTVLPFCIASGKRATLEEWGQCASCELPYRASAMRRVVDVLGECPMCGAPTEVGDVRKLGEKDAKEAASRIVDALDMGSAM